MSNNGLTIKYLINLLNDQTDLKINKQKYFIDSYPTLKIGTHITCDTLLSSLLIAYKNIQYNVDDVNYRINVDTDILKNEKSLIQKTLFDSNIELGKKRKLIGLFNNLTTPTNEFILVLTLHFGINVLLYQTETQTTKCFYWDNCLDRDLPFVVIKETKESDSPNYYYELVFSQNKFIFEFTHPVITELMPISFIIGLEHNKQLEYLKCDKVADIILDNINEENMDTLSEENYSDNVSIFSEKKIKLKMIPLETLKLIDELQTMNFDILAIPPKQK